MRHLLMLLLLLPSGCDSLDSWQAHTMTDQGRVCLYADTEAASGYWLGDHEDQSFVPDASVAVGFYPHVCLSSSCSRFANASCSVSLDGSTLTVSGSASYEQNVSPNVGCTSDCGLLQAVCETPSLPAGSYTLVFAGMQASFEVPSTDTVCLNTPLGD